MEHKIVIKKLGPIKECHLDVNEFTIFTGPQSNGKSTVAKAIYYFRTIKQDILNIMQQGGPATLTGEKNAKWMFTLQQRLRNKFLELFGTSWIMPDDMEMIYTYCKNVWIRVFLESDRNSSDKNFVQFEFSGDIQNYIIDLDNQSFSDLTTKVLEAKENKLNRLFDDKYETVFIPAGRSLITILTNQLNYIFTSLDNSQLRNIDYITRRYIELILKVRPIFKEGYESIGLSAENDPDRAKKYNKNKGTIRLLIERATEILSGNYRYIDGEERLYINSGKYVKINFSSSGQQEIVWVFNLLFYFLLEDKKVFLILEEPESHLYPQSQQGIGEILAMFLNEGNQVLVTTHSPYLLGTFNYLLLAGQTSDAVKKEMRNLIRHKYWLAPDTLSAYYVSGGSIEDALDKSDQLVLVKNELIDEASDSINSISDTILGYLYSADDSEEG